MQYTKGMQDQMQLSEMLSLMTFIHQTLLLKNNKHIGLIVDCNCFAGAITYAFFVKSIETLNAMDASGVFLSVIEIFSHLIHVFVSKINKYRVKVRRTLTNMED